MKEIHVGVAVPKRDERDAVIAALEHAGMSPESLVEACHVDSEVAKRGFGCIVADGTLLASGYLASVRKQDPRVPVVALIDPAQAHESSRGGGVSVLPRPFDACTVALTVELAYRESRQARARTRRRTPRVPSRVSGARATIVDISPDGVRLELSTADASKLGVRFRLQVPMVALDVALHRVWVARGRRDTVECGARLVNPDPSQVMAWQRIMDLSAATLSLPGMRDDESQPVPAESRLLARVSSLLASTSLADWAQHLARSR